MSTDAAGNRKLSPRERARLNEQALNDRVEAIVEKARRKGTARPPSPVTTRRVDPETLR